MKKIFIFLAAIMTVLAFASCDPQNPTGNPDDGKTPGGDEQVEVELNQSIKFTLNVASLSDTGASIQVSHDGKAKDTWYGFVTTESNVNEAYTKKYMELTEKGGNITGLRTMTNYTAELSGLTPETKYTYIVFGITRTGELFGKPASISFTTKKDVKMVENKAWTVKHITFDPPKELEGQTFEHGASVTSTDKNLYIVCAYPNEFFTKYDLKTIAEDGLYQFMQSIAYFNQMNPGANITIDKILQPEAYYEEVFSVYPGDWKAIAIGVEKTGDLSGLYALSEVFTIKEEEPTPEFASWLGDWTWTGSNGVSFDVTIEKAISNIGYYIKGWENPRSEEEAVGLRIPAMWSQEEKAWIIYPNSFGVMDLGDPYGKAEILLMGAQKVGEQPDYKDLLFPYPELPICVGFIDDNGKTVANSMTDFTLEEGSSQKYTINYMAYYFALENNEIYKYFETKAYPEFPLTLTKRQSAAPASVKEEVEEGINVKQNFSKLKKTRVVGTYFNNYCRNIAR